MKNFIEEKIIEKKAQINYLQQEIAYLEKQNIKTKNKTDISKWLDYLFESSSGLTEEFDQFAREYKKAVIKQLPDNCELVSFNRGHFYMSAFIRNNETKKLVYISTSDVRHFSNSWYNNILIRTAQHDKDYTGGSNCFTTYLKLKENIEKLTR